jgi:hypothetical protein
MVQLVLAAPVFLQDRQLREAPVARKVLEAPEWWGPERSSR